MINSKKMKKGFTLIELLVVVAIIGILASFLIANFISAKQRARDAERKSDLRQIQGALELYRSDLGSYPGSLPGCGSSLASGSTTYIKKMPCDPLTTTTRYTYTQVGAGYTIRACLENGNDSQKDATNTCGGGTHSYTLTNP